MEVSSFFESGMNHTDIIDLTKEEILRDVQKSILHKSARVSSCHVFSGQKADQLLNEANVHFNRSCDYPLPLNPTIGSADYNDKIDALSSNLSSVSVYAKSLYGLQSSSSVIYNYYLYGEESGVDTDKFHEGVDTDRSLGVSLFNVVPNGQVIKKNAPASTSSTSYVAVYDSLNDITVYYLHLKVSSNISVSSSPLPDNTIIGTENKYGAKDTHTHIEIHDGRDSSGNLYKEDTTLSGLDPYAYLWFY